MLIIGDFFIILFPTMQRHCNENLKQIFTEMKRRSLVPNSYIHVHVSVNDLYIPTIDKVREESQF
jgi:hypothetical protein